MRRFGLAAACVLTALLFIIIWFAKPGDTALYPPTEANPQKIHLVSHGWHSGLILPREVLTGDGAGAALRSVAIRFRDYDNIEFGWGEARFYRATPTVKDVDWGLAARALFTSGGTEGVIQVVGLPEDVGAAFPNSTIVPVAVSRAGLARLVARLDAAFRLEGNQPVEGGPGLYGPSLFYAGTGRFSWHNVCNHWTAGLLNAAGLPVAPVVDTHPRGLILDLEWRSGLTPLPAR